MWVEALLVTMRFLRTKIGNFRIWSDWKWNGFLLLVVLALSRPKKARELVSQLPRWSFWGICELEGLVLVTWGQKSLFPCRPTLHNPFCSHIYWCGDTQKRHLGFFVHPFVTQWFYCVQDCTWECASAHGTWMLPLVDLPESYSVTLWVASEKRANQTKVLAVRNWKSIWYAIRSTPYASPPHLSGRTGRDKYGACISKGQA